LGILARSSALVSRTRPEVAFHLSTRSYSLTLVYVANVTPNVFDDADRLMVHNPAAIDVFHLLIRPQIASTNAGARDANDRVGWIDDFWLTHILDANIASLIHYRCTHNSLPPVA
jgi:hypothetical protein